MPATPSVSAPRSSISKRPDRQPRAPKTRGTPPRAPPRVCFPREQNVFYGIRSKGCVLGLRRHSASGVVSSPLPTSPPNSRGEGVKRLLYYRFASRPLPSAATPLPGAASDGIRRSRSPMPRWPQSLVTRPPAFPTSATTSGAATAKVHGDATRESQHASFSPSPTPTATAARSPRSATSAVHLSDFAPVT